MDSVSARTGVGKKDRVRTKARTRLKNRNFFIIYAPFPFIGLAARGDIVYNVIIIASILRFVNVGGEAL